MVVEANLHAAGYQRLKENVTNGKADNHEGLDFYRPVETPDKSKPLWGVNQWPSQPAEFKDKYQVWVDKMKALGLIVMKAYTCPSQSSLHAYLHVVWPMDWV